MKRPPYRLIIILSAIFLFTSFLTVQAQSKKAKNLGPAPAPPLAETVSLNVVPEDPAASSPGRIAIGVPSGITRIRVVSETRPDTIVTRDIKGAKSVVMELKLNSGENKFNVIAYKDNSIVFSSSEPYTIMNSGDAAKDDDKPKTNEGQTGNTNSAQKPNPKKIIFNETPTISNKPTYDLSLNLGDLTDAPDCPKDIVNCEFTYVVTVTHVSDKTNKNESKVIEFPILTADEKVKGGSKNLTAKNETPLKDQKISIQLFDKGNDNTISVVAKYRNNITSTQSETLKVTYNKDSEPNDPKKVQLKSPPKLNNQATYTVNINLDKTALSGAPDSCPTGKTCKFQYIIKAQSESGDVRTHRVPIQTQDKDKKANLTAKDQKPLTDQKETIGLFEGKNTVTVYADYNGEIAGTESDPLTVDCTNCSDSGSSTSTRAIVGFEQIGASSTDSEQHPFVDFFFSSPFKYGLTFGGRRRSYITSIWGNVRFSNIPVQNLAAFATFNPGTGVSFLGEDSSKPSKLTPTFTALVGIEQQLKPQGQLGMGFLPGKSSVYFIAGAGVTNVLKPDQTPRIFKVPRDPVTNKILPPFLLQYPEADPDGTFDGVSDITNIVFVPEDRTKFFRQYFFGLRIKTFFYDDDGAPLKLFPAQVDFTLGQNESLTERLSGFILRFDGSTPLPIKNNNFLYLFGGLEMALGKNKTFKPSPFVLESQAADSTISNSNTIYVRADRAPGFQRTRDIFRIGIGIDLFRIFRQQPEQ